jgi:phage gp46-like protein
MAQIDPVKRDFVLVNGSTVSPDRVYEACYYALKIPDGAWLYGAQGQGSLLYTLQNVKRTSNIEQKFASFSSDAIQRQVIATGKATAQQIENIQATATGTSNQIEVIPSQSPINQQFAFTPV